MSYIIDSQSILNKKRLLLFVGSAVLLAISCYAVTTTTGSGTSTLSIDSQITQSGTNALLWNTTWGGSGADWGRSVWGDGFRVYTCGDTQSYGAVGKDIVLIASNPSTGSKLWNRTWSTTSDDYAYCVWGDTLRVYTVGYNGTVGGEDLVLIAWNPLNGNQMWNSTWNGISASKGYAVWGDGTKVYTCGGTGGDILLVAWNPINGQQLWNRTWSTVYEDSANAVWGDGTRLFTAGYRSDAGGGTDTVVVAWNATTGNYMWNKTWGLNDYDGAMSVWGDGTNIYTAGYSNGFLDTTLAVIAWNPVNGNSVWNYTLPSGTATSVHGVGTRLFVGAFIAHPASYDLAIIALDPGTGTAHWINYWGASSANDYAYGIWSDGIRVFTAGLTGSYGVGGGADIVIVSWDIRGKTPSSTFSASKICATTGEQITFSYTGSGGDGPLSFDWGFGDTTSNSTSEDPTHVYTSEGTFQVVLTVTDGDGDSVVSNPLTVAITTAAPSSTVPGYEPLLILASLAFITTLIIAIAKRRDSMAV